MRLSRFAAPRRDLAPVLWFVTAALTPAVAGAVMALRTGARDAPQAVLELSYREFAVREDLLAIDGSVVSVDVDGELRTGATATGWAVSPALGQAHPFAISPPGHSQIVERAVRGGIGAVTVLELEEYSMKDGQLRVAEIEIPTSTGTTRRLTVGAWEGRGGCLSTSLRGSERKRLVEVFDTLAFGPHRNGLAIESRVVPTPRAPEVVKEVPGLGLLTIRPALPLELERVPSGRGLAVPGGELFRHRHESRALLFLSRSTITRITPMADIDNDEMARRASQLRIEWRPRRAA